ncbi:MAG TPA: NAD(P)/FAD-dependent oxidoreductase [Caldimonas sp.]|jgi:cation diffusion facilitator CzcD-associated flavoprotein CzcO|nr:NAD(P)/FAD-dependent oxidoreductase [Caldimonas sp.]
MDTDVLVIGAGPAGLAAAATLQAKGRRPLVIEKAAQVGASWRDHYERLHLHTVKTLSTLPGMKFPDEQPRYVPRQGVVDYLAAYAARAGIAPRFGEEATAIARDERGGWRTTTRSGNAFRSNAVVVSTGANNHPFAPKIEGEEAFGAAGAIVHSRDYRNAAPFAGRRVLVVGMGNTGAEIALDLAEHGVAAALSVRSPVNIVYRDFLGRPTQQTSILLSHLPNAIGDALARFLCDVTVGDIGRYGLQRSPVSPLRQLREHGRTPVIDVGTLARIKSGEIAVYPGLRRLVAGGAEFVDGRSDSFDAIVLATGYRAGVAALFTDAAVPVDDSGLPTALVGTGDLAGVYFIGFDLRQAGGLLRTIAQQASAVAERIAATPKPARAPPAPSP